MKRFIMIISCLLSLIPYGYAQDSKPKSKVEKLVIEYKGKTVKARQLSVCSEIPMNIDSAWVRVQKPALLQFVAKGMIRFKTNNGELPKQWELGQQYGAKMRLFGFIPFGGKHYFYIKEIDEQNHILSAKEWNRRTKVWNHDVILKDLGNESVLYEDAITIYGGIMTGVITSFAKKFYKHRQKRWQIVAKENLNFAE